jgi:polyisoprenoid-binding protein YceI
MRILKVCLVGLVALFISVLAIYQLDHLSRAFLPADDSVDWSASGTTDEMSASAEPVLAGSPARVASRYRLDSTQSKFVAHAIAGGLLWFKGHDHLVSVGQFTGEAQLTPDTITAATLNITAKADSMVETSSVFTEPQKQIIDKELREIVLEPARYPDIAFRSTSVTGNSSGSQQYDLKITGDLSLHGVTRQITIPTKVTVTGNDLRALGEFSIDRSDFNVKATSAVHGLVRVHDRVKFNFDIIGHQF